MQRPRGRSGLGAFERLQKGQQSCKAVSERKRVEQRGRGQARSGLEGHGKELDL